MVVSLSTNDQPFPAHPPMACMVITTPSRGDDPQPGKRVGQGLQRAQRFAPAAAMHLDIELHQPVQFMRRRDAEHQHSQRIADEIPRRVVA